MIGKLVEPQKLLVAISSIERSDGCGPATPSTAHIAGPDACHCSKGFLAARAAS
jgi:hypothetical protein